MPRAPAVVAAACVALRAHRWHHTAVLYVCVRRTLEWGDEAAVTAGLRPEFRPKVATWNATFTLPYHRFRQRLKEIAASNLARIADARVAPLADVPPGALIVPVDDDDWFAPDLVHRLMPAVDAQADGSTWTGWALEPVRRPKRLRLLIRSLRTQWTCGSNNYVVRNLPALAPLVGNHIAASRHFDAHANQVRHVAVRLSIQNRNLASQTALAWKRPTIAPTELRAVYERYRTFYDTVSLPNDLGWAAPYVALVGELTHELRLR